MTRRAIRTFHLSHLGHRASEPSRMSLPGKAASSVDRFWGPFQRCTPLDAFSIHIQPESDTAEHGYRANKPESPQPHSLSRLKQ